MEKTTIDVLKNAASINQGILFLKGSTIRTMSVLKNVFMTAEVPDVFDKEFAIYDLNEFLSTLSLFEKPQFSFKDDHILIESGNSRVKYFYSSPNVVVSPPKGKTITINGDMKFNLPESVLTQVIKAASVMSLAQLEISDKGLKAFNKTSVGNRYDVSVKDVEGTCPPVILLIENLKMIPKDYKVEVCNRAVKFTSVDGDLEYIVSVESD